MKGLWTYSQELVFQSFDLGFNGAIDSSRIGRVNIVDCTNEIIKLTTGGVLYFSDITLDSDSTFYRYIPIDGLGDPINFLLRLEFEPVFHGTGVGEFQDFKEGMTCDKEGGLYLAGESLSRWQNGQITELGNLPLSMACRGDLTFRKGKLYLSSISNTLVEVDLDDPMNSSVVMNFPSGVDDIHGLATVNVTCDSVETYAAASHPINGSIIYRINFETMTLEEVCHYNFFITGLASYDECKLPDCFLNIDLDEDNSTSATGNDFQSTTACTFPISITDTDISFISDLSDIDSIRFVLTNTQASGEYLAISSSNNIDVIGDGTDQLLFVNNGSSTIQDFEQAIANVLYSNDDLNPSSGQREITIIAYTGPYQSNLATSYIPIGEADFDPAFVIEEITCNGLADASILSDPQGGTAPYSFSWSNNQSGNQINSLDTGQYFLTLTDALGCEEVESIIITQPEALEIVISNLGFDSICNENGVLLAISNGGTAPFTYTWSDGFDAELNEELNPGNHSVTIEDANGCETESAYTLEEGTEFFVSLEESPCYGETILIEGESYTADTSFCLTSIMSNGCDSTRCYELDFYEENTTSFSDEICDGDSLLIFGNYYLNDTMLNFTEIDINGCDSVLVFDLNVFDPIDIQFETIGNLCDGGEVVISAIGYVDYDWSNGTSSSSITVTDPGDYVLTVIDDNGCSATNSILVEETELSVHWSVVDPSCFGESDGMIQIDSITGGGSTITTSLNNSPFSLDPLYIGLSAGTYTLEANSSNNCTAFIELELTEPDEIIIESEESFLLLSGENINVSITTNINQAEVLWMPNDFLDCSTCFENDIQPTNSILYEVMVIDTNGCSVSQFIDVQVEETASLFVPNVFSPNGDLINDNLKVYGSPLISKIVDMTIISRNGHVVYNDKNFEADESQQGWDGRFRNQDAQIGVYVLYVEYEDVRGNLKTEIYSLTLVR